MVFCCSRQQMDDGDVDHCYKHHRNRNNRYYIADNNNHNEDNIYNTNRYNTAETTTYTLRWIYLRTTLK